MPKVSKKDQVIAYWRKNKKLSVKEIAANLDMHYATVRHALKSIDSPSVAVSKKSTKKVKKVDELPKDDPRIFLKNGEISCTCPHCGKDAKATIVSAELKNNQYVKTASGTCPHKKCGGRYTLYDVKMKR